MTAVVDLQKARKKAKSTSVDLEAGGYSHELMNSEFAFLLVGSKAVVIRENPEAPLEQRVRFLTLDAFRQWSLNRFTEMRDPSGDVKTVTCPPPPSPRTCSTA